MTLVSKSLYNIDMCGRYQVEITKWMHFYLDGLANWNDAKICSYEMGQRFSTEVLLDKWRKVIETVGEDKGISVNNRRLE